MATALTIRYICGALATGHPVTASAEPGERWLYCYRTDAIRMLETTGVDGVMIGRAALHNPFIFRDILAYVSGVPAGNEVDRRIEAMHRYLAKIDGAPQVINWKLHKARTVIGWFSKGIAHGKDIRNGLADVTSVADVRRLLDAARVRLAA